MTDILLIIIILLLVYLIHMLKGKAEESNTASDGFSYAKVLPDYLNRSCEIIVKEPLAAIDVMFTVKGILLDFDEEWLMLEVKGKKASITKMLRIENISSIKEIME